ncbi:MAG TPA: MBL fold metallo-hydrolase [Candidatus Sulfotelmatobacter sp.]|nr:MBL fold metallo-hydrolase [Candidatus Sulfotelmatobacter sp.]
MELYPGAYQIRSLFRDGRWLFQYLLVGSRVLLVDSGIAETPANTILPYMDKLGLAPDRLSMVITTHPDLDHQGGNSALCQSAPHALFACGEADRHMVEDPKCLFRDRYNFLRKEHGVAMGDEIPPEAGSRCRVDIGFRGGEQIAIDNNWEIEVLHVPGHSHGHLALYDAAHKAAYVSDAIHGHGCPKQDGSMGIPVTYFYIDLYLSTIAYLERLQLEHLYTGHWPSMEGEEIRDFFNDSRKTVEILDRRILRSLKLSRTGMTLNELMDAAMDEFPDWPSGTRILSSFPIKGHLDRLEARQQVRMDRSSSPVRWTLA